MNKVLYIILIFLFNLTIISCAIEDEPFYSDPFTDTTAPVILEVIIVTTSTNDSTPDYTFSSDEAGTITYGGSCSSEETSATRGNNTITLVSLSEGTYSDCTITVTDEAGNISIKLTITSFIVDTTVPVISGSTITTPTNDNTPDFIISSSEAGTITYGGFCSSSTTFATAGTITVTLYSLSDGTYSNCTITVTDSAGNSVTLNITSFTVAIPPTIEEVTFVTSPTNDSTPDYTFSSDEAGTITYVGSCSSSTTSAIDGNNTITLVSLSEGTYSNCTITVTDSAENVSKSLTITSFIVDLTAATLAEVTAVTTLTYDNTPDYTFSSSEAGTITYGGSCSSSTTSATTDNNTITLNSLSDGTFSYCTITVTDSAGNSVTRNINSFVIDTTAPTVSSISPTDNQSSVSITDNITVTFSEAMDNTSVITNTDNTTCSGTLRLSSDNFSSCIRMSSAPASSNSNKTFTLDPYDNLTRLTTYLTGVTTGVKDTAGNTLSSQYETSSGFTTLSLSAPSNLIAIGSAGQVTLDWNAVSGANGYTVYWDNTTGMSSSSTAITSISTDNYTHSSLDNGSTYYYKVAAFDTDNTTGYLSSEVSAATPLPAPDNLSASGVNNTITLTWNSVSGATSYTLYWDNASGIDSSDNVIDNITNVNYTHSSLSDATYYYKVAAVNSSGTGTLSSVASALLSASIQGSLTYNAHTYAITSANMNFANAKAVATALGGYLTTVNTKAENTFLTTQFYGTYGSAIWIGANDIDIENTWVWDNGTTSGDSGLTDDICGSTGCPNSDEKWADGTTRKWHGVEPNDNGVDGEDCASITNDTGGWNDLPCTDTLYGIIEFD